jgi:hypothetical protein
MISFMFRLLSAVSEAKNGACATGSKLLRATLRPCGSCAEPIPAKAGVPQQTSVIVLRILIGYYIYNYIFRYHRYPKSTLYFPPLHLQVIVENGNYMGRLQNLPFGCPTGQGFGLRCHRFRLSPDVSGWKKNSLPQRAKQMAPYSPLPWLFFYGAPPFFFNSPPQSADYPVADWFNAVGESRTECRLRDGRAGCPAFSFGPGAERLLPPCGRRRFPPPSPPEWGKRVRVRGVAFPSTSVSVFRFDAGAGILHEGFEPGSGLCAPELSSNGRSTMANKTSRNFSRVPYQSEATLKMKDGEFSAQIANLSLNGMLLATAEKPAIGGDVEIAIRLAAPASDVTLDLTGVVARHTDEGFAIRFTGMYLDIFLRLRDLIGDSLGDRRKVLEEFLSFMSE